MSNLGTVTSICTSLKGVTRLIIDVYVYFVSLTAWVVNAGRKLSTERE